MITQLLQVNPIAIGYWAPFGESIPSAEAGMKLPNAKTFARVHGWSFEIDTDSERGVRLLVLGARIERTEKPTPRPES